MTTTADVGSGGPPEVADQPLLSLRGITKNFGAVQALRGVDLDILPGKVTALVGDNGAGKSTHDQDDLGDLVADVGRDAAGTVSR